MTRASALTRNAADPSTRREARSAAATVEVYGIAAAAVWRHNDAMKKRRGTPTDIDQYIALFPKDVRTRLADIRNVIRTAAPGAEEAIKYQMPTFVLNGNLVHFAAFTHHIGFYPAPMGIEKFKRELSQFKGAKGSVQFPLDRPVPLNLIGRIVAYRVRQNLAKAAVKSGARSAARAGTRKHGAAASRTSGMSVTRARVRKA